MIHEEPKVRLGPRKSAGLAFIERPLNADGKSDPTPALTHHNLIPIESEISSAFVSIAAPSRLALVVSLRPRAFQPAPFSPERHLDSVLRASLVQLLDIY